MTSDDAQVAQAFETIVAQLMLLGLYRHTLESAVDIVSNPT